MMIVLGMLKAICAGIMIVCGVGMIMIGMIMVDKKER